MTDASTVRIGNAMGIPALLSSLGVDPAPLLAEVGIEPTLFDNPDNRISFNTRSRLVQLCVARTGCSHFGLLIGAQAGLRSMGPLGLLMKYSPDVGSALRSLVRHLHLHGRGGAATLAVQGDTATLGYQVHIAQSLATDQIGDGAAALMFNMMRSLCGKDWAPAEVWFAHRRPEDIRPFHRLFRVPLRFDREQNALVFRASDLQRGLPTHDPEIQRLLQRQIEALEAAQSDDLPRQIKIMLRTALADGSASADQVAARFAMHTRTLNRRLHACGTTFRTLVNGARFETACQMLEQSSMDVRQIALQLGYADASAFARAFRRWSGRSPVAWRMARIA